MHYRLDFIASDAIHNANYVALRKPSIGVTITSRVHNITLSLPDLQAGFIYRHNKALP